MVQHDPLTAFFLALEESPGDPVTLQAMADWFEEQGESDNAACLRWLVRRGLYPFRYGSNSGLIVSSPTFCEDWYWWAVNDPYFGRDWGHPNSCRLPRALWVRLKNLFPYEPRVCKHYETVRAAYEALMAVWPLVSPADREKQS